MLDRRSGYEYEDLLACGRGEMFGPGNAHLPLPPMLMFDRITEISEKGGEFGKGMIRAELDVKPDLWFFGCHFKNDPVMPGCLGLDAMWQMVGFFLGWTGSPGRGRALGMATAALLGNAASERTLTLTQEAVVHVRSDSGVCGLLRGDQVLDTAGMDGCDIRVFCQ